MFCSVARMKDFSWFSLFVLIYSIGLFLWCMEDILTLIRRKIEKSEKESKDKDRYKKSENEKIIYEKDNDSV